MHILKRGVVFPPAPHEICKRGQKHSFFHDEGGWLPALIYQVDAWAALHIQTPEARISARAHQRVSLHTSCSGMPEDRRDSKPLYKQVLGKRDFLCTPPDLLLGHMGDETSTVGSPAGDGQQ